MNAFQALGLNIWCSDELKEFQVGYAVRVSEK
jgi:hypothetical protein